MIGATAIEYVVIASLVSVAIIAGASALGSALAVTYVELAGKF
jgi:pilus assembly protein Flp/PilA